MTPTGTTLADETVLAGIDSAGAVVGVDVATTDDAVAFVVVDFVVDVETVASDVCGTVPVVLWD